MSRDQTTAFQTEMDADDTTLFFLAEAEFPGGTLRFWGGYGTLTWDSNDYTGAGELLKIAPPEESTLMESAGAVFELSVEDPAMISAALSSEYQDRLCRIYTGTWDLSTDSVIADPYFEFEGRMSTMVIKKGGKSGVIRLHAEDELVILQRDRERRQTSEDQNKNYAGDKGFDFKSSLQNKEVPWGR